MSHGKENYRAPESETIPVLIETAVMSVGDDDNTGGQADDYGWNTF